MSYFAWRPYVPVAKRRQQAAQKLAKMKKQGRTVAPVVIEGRTIAKSFWGKSWCDNLERYSDYENRLPRGRTYVRNSSVLDLQIAKGEVAALVSGSELYTIKITIAPVAAPRWKAICKDCSSGIDSLVELLQGRLSKGVMDRVCREGDGLFPAPKDIKLSCSCPDWADMCKHVAAVLYGVGARLDQQPELLFRLRDVDEKDLIAGADTDLSLTNGRVENGKVLADDDVAALFGLDMVPATAIEAPDSRVRPKSSKVTKPSKASSAGKAGKAAKSAKSAKGMTAANAAKRIAAAARKSAQAKAAKPSRKGATSQASAGRGKTASRNRDHTL